MVGCMLRADDRECYVVWANCKVVQPTVVFIKPARTSWASQAGEVVQSIKYSRGGPRDCSCLCSLQTQNYDSYRIGLS